MKTRIINLPILLVAFCMTALFLSSCKKDNEPIVYGNTNVKIVNTVAASQPQDFYQGDQKVSTASLAFGASSSTYYTVTGGPSIYSFKDAGTATTTAAINYSLEEGSYYTLYYYTAENGSVGIAGIRNDVSAPAAGKAKVRFLNLGFALTNSLKIYQTLGGAIILNSLPTGFSNYSTIDANTGLSVTVIGSPTTLTIDGSSFVAGKIYTVWFDSITPTTVNYHIVAEN